jgi:hypothetical protein
LPVFAFCSRLHACLTVYLSGVSRRYQYYSSGVGNA